MKKPENAKTPNEAAETSYVEVDVIRNKFTELLSKLESMLPQSQQWSIRMDVLDMVESCKFSILKFRQSSPEIFQKTAYLRTPGEQTSDQREAHQGRLLAIRSRTSS